jgi:hypothetical protein
MLLEDGICGFILAILLIDPERDITYSAFLVYIELVERVFISFWIVMNIELYIFIISTNLLNSLFYKISIRD